MAQEKVIKEYPNSTRLLEGKKVTGIGNLILTTERLVFLHLVALDDRQTENLQKTSGTASLSELLDYALTLHKKSFQLPLSSVISARTGLFSLLPLPRPCLRISYRSEKKKNIQTASFMFYIPLLKGFYQFEITTVLLWVWLTNRAVRYKQAAARKAIQES